MFRQPNRACQAYHGPRSLPFWCLMALWPVVGPPRSVWLSEQGMVCPSRSMHILPYYRGLNNWFFAKISRRKTFLQNRGGTNWYHRNRSVIGKMTNERHPILLFLLTRHTTDTLIRRLINPPPPPFIDFSGLVCCCCFR